MNTLNEHQVKKISAGITCFLVYEAHANASYLPFLSQYLLKLQENQITAAQFLQTLTAAGLSPSNLIMDVRTLCTA